MFMLLIRQLLLLFLLLFNGHFDWTEAEIDGFPGPAPSYQAAPAAPILHPSEHCEVSQLRGTSSILDLQVPPPPVLPYSPLWVPEEVQITARQSPVLTGVSLPLYSYPKETLVAGRPNPSLPTPAWTTNNAAARR